MRSSFFALTLAMMHGVAFGQQVGSIGGTWVHGNDRTVAGIGPADEILKIYAGRDATWVSYTLGNTEVIRDSEGHRFEKKVTTTYSGIPIFEDGGQYVFTVPEVGTKFRLQRRSMDGKEILKGTRKLKKKKLGFQKKDPHQPKDLEVVFWKQRVRYGGGYGGGNETQESDNKGLQSSRK